MHVYCNSCILLLSLSYASMLIETIPCPSPSPCPSSPSPVPAGGEASTTFTISPKNALEPVRSLTVTFESNQLEGIMGHTKVQVVA